VTPIHIHIDASHLIQGGSTTSAEGTAMYLYLLENDLAQSRDRAAQVQAEAAARARRLYLARRAARRAERAVLRAARANAAVQ
jgi:hypothetical protein